MRAWPWKKRNKIWTSKDEPGATEAWRLPKAASKASARRFAPAYAAAMGALYGRAAVRPRGDELVRAWGCSDHAGRKLVEARASLARDEAALAAAPDGSLIDAVIHGAGSVIGLAAELVMNLIALPFVFDIQPSSFEGLAIAAAPTAAMLILDVIIERLIEGPYRRRASLDKTKRAIAYVVMGIFKVLAVALLVYTVALVAGARELAHTDAPDGASVANVDITLHQTSLAIALLVCLASGWFTALAIADLKAWYHRHSLKLSIERGRREVDGAAQAAASASGALAAASLAARDSAADADDTARAVRAAILMEVVDLPAPTDEMRELTGARRGPRLDELVRVALRVQARRRLAGDT